MADARTDLRRLFGNGITQTNLVDLLVAIRASIVGIQAKLDLDAGVTDVNYSSLAATLLAAFPTGIQTTGVKAIFHQGLVTDFLNDALTKWNATLTKLDADAGVADTNYNALWAITDTVGNQKIDGLFDAGQYQGNLINLLDTFIASINGVTSKLDLDAQVTDVNYRSLWGLTDNVDSLNTWRRPQIGAMILLALSVAALLGFSRPAHAIMSLEGNVVQTTATSNNLNPTIDVGSYDRFSMQAAYQDGTPSSSTAQGYTDGRKSSDTLTLSAISTSTIQGSRALAFLAINPAAALTTQSFTLNGYLFAAGGLWPINTVSTSAVTNISSNTAINIVAAINSYGPLSGVVSSTVTVGQSTVTITAVSTGAAQNSYTLATSSALGIQISTVGLTSAFVGTGTSINFSSGTDATVITIGTITLTAGVDYVVSGPTNTVAINLSNAINNNQGLKAIIISVSTGGVINATSTIVGVNNYSVSSSSPALLTWASPTFINGLVSDMDATNDRINIANVFPVGLKVLISSVSAPNGVVPSTNSLVTGTTYFVYASLGSSFQLSTGAAASLTGPVIDISTNLAGGNAFTATPLALSAAPAGMNWQCSNNGTDWTDISSTGTASGNQLVESSVTFSVSGNSAWDFQWYNFRYLRPKIIAPTTGGVMWTIRVKGKRDQE